MGYCLKILVPVMLFAFSTLALIVHKISLLYALTLAREPSMSSFARYTLMAIILLIPQAISMLQLVWNIPMFTKPLAVFLKDSVENSMNMCKRPLSLVTTLVLVLSTVSPAGAALWMYLFSDLALGYACVLAIAVPLLGYIWTLVMDPGSPHVATVQVSRRIHLFYGLFRILMTAAFLSLVFRNELFTSSQTEIKVYANSATISEQPKINYYYLCVSILTLSECLFVSLSYAALCVCQPVHGSYLPSVCSTLIASSIGFFLDLPVPDILTYPLHLVLYSILLVLCAVVPYLAGCHILPQVPTHLLLPFDQMVNDYIWSGLFLDLKFILTSYTREQQLLLIETIQESNKADIFVCATMYRETKQEMQLVLESLQKLANSKFIPEVTFSFHIFFDDGCNDQGITSHACELFKILQENIMDPKTCIVFRTPYGLQYKADMNSKVTLRVHLKNKNKFKLKKRWSQVMYFHYILKYCVGAKSIEDGNGLYDQTDSENFELNHDGKLLKVGAMYLDDCNNSGASVIDESQSLQDELISDMSSNDSFNDCYLSNLIKSSEVLLREETHEDIDLDISLPESESSSTDTSQENVCLTEGNQFNNEMGSWVNCDLANTYILSIDGDMKFEPHAVKSMFDRLHEDGRVGAACGRTYPCGSMCSSIVWYQKFEYSQDFWLVKASQNVFGSVRCCPGCFSMYRASAISEILDDLSQPTETPFQIYLKDIGEDRWLTVMLMLKGWTLSYVSQAKNVTICPDSFPEFLRQRKRWILSEMANENILFVKIPHLVFGNPSFTLFYSLYSVLGFFGKMLLPSCLIFLVSVVLGEVSQVSFPVTLGAWLFLLSFYVVVCVMASDSVQTRTVMVYTIIFGLTFTFCFVAALINTGKIITDAEPQNQSFYAHMLLFLPLAAFVYGAILNMDEIFNLIYFPVYMFYLPLGTILLPLYSIANIGDQRWGTRDPNQISTDTISCCVNLSSKGGKFLRNQGYDQLPTVDVTQEESNKNDDVLTQNFHELDTENVQEATFWEKLKDTVMGSNVNLGKEEDEIVRGLRRLRNICLVAYLSINAVWLMLLCYMYLGSPEMFVLCAVPLNVTVIIVTLVHVLGLSLTKLYGFMRALATHVYGVDIPTWRASSSDSIRTGTIKAYN